ncbi:MAG TPA: hypothetical protein PK177_06165 [Burkholderiaceae bacterium]|nr:hypothetical protein [Burkholderiaceae bacterium]
MSCVAQLGGLRCRLPGGADRALAPSVHAWAWVLGSVLLASIGLPSGHADGAAFIVLGWGAGVAMYGVTVVLGRVERLHRQLLDRESMACGRPGR